MMEQKGATAKRMKNKFKMEQFTFQHWSKAETLRVPTWKRPLDSLLLLATLPGWLPLMIGVSLYIKLVSKGPIFYKQDRIGFKGDHFLCFKFRSMKVDAPTSVHQNYVVDLINSDKPMRKLDQKGDPRLIPGGAFLRATGLDELPQLLNIMLGQMSFVGPRPCTPYEFENYLPYHRRRCEVLPGLTGYWQVNGKNATTFSEMIRMDIYYVDYCSVWVDLRIIARTFGVLYGQVKGISKTA